MAMTGAERQRRWRKKVKGALNDLRNGGGCTTTNAQKLAYRHRNRQMCNDCRRLGLSAAEWRRQVQQGIITLNEGA